jgi:2,3-bisphosphoglycerate-independent phosphoglycerate mutase
VTVPRVVFWFVDGLGLGPEDPEDNPLLQADTPTLRSLLGGPLCAASFPACGEYCSAVALDATLGVPGRPQSGTGQVALLAGCNAAALEGRHVPGFPTARLRAVLRQDSVFRRLRARGLSVALANAYPPTFFSEVRRPRGAFAWAAEAAGVRLWDLEDLRRGQAVAADLTGEALARRGHPVPVVTPEEAGRRLGSFAARHAFTAFEFFALDLVAHGRWPGSVDAVLEQLDRALGAVLRTLDLDECLLVLTSDHGGAESRDGTHTTNPVPLVVVGKHACEVARRCRSLVDVAPALEAALAV